MEKTVTVPEGISVSREDNFLVVKGPKGELKKGFRHPRINLKIEGNTVNIKSDIDRKKINAVVGTWAAHLRNMAAGVKGGWESKLKVVYSHFPVKVNVEGDTVLIQNFGGERKPRTSKIVGDTKVEIKKDEIIVSGTDKEAVGQTSSNLELITKVKAKDKRVFQDGIYITSKPKPVEVE